MQDIDILNLVLAIICFVGIGLTVGRLQYEKLIKKNDDSKGVNYGIY